MPVGAEPSGTPFVGRAEEIGVLCTAFDLATAGKGSIITVSGEPGIGKSALCEQLTAYAVRQGGNVLRGHCHEEAALSLPYVGFLEAMRSHVLLEDPKALHTQLGIGAADLARILSPIRDRLGVQARPASNSEEDRWELLNNASDFMCNIAAARPLLLFIEDLQWADSGSFDLSIHLAQRISTSSLLLVGTYRDTETERLLRLTPVLAELGRNGAYRRITLTGLSPEEVHELHRRLAGVEVSEEASRLLHERTEGNPLFVLEVLRTLGGESGARQPGELLHAGLLPVGLREVIDLSFQRLTSDCRELLSVASVIGRDFPLDVVVSISGLEEASSLKLLDEAVHARAIEERYTPGQPRFRFRHALFRQSLYESLPFSRRAHLHHTAGRVLEERYGVAAEEHAAELSEHFAHSTEVPDLIRALDYASVACERAFSVYAFGEAGRMGETMLSLQTAIDASNHEAILSILMRQGEALLALHERSRILDEIAPAAVKEAQAIGDSIKAFEACCLALDATIGGTSMVGSHWESVSEEFANSDAARVRLNRHKAGGLGEEGFAAEASRLLDESVRLARRSGDGRAEFTSLALLLVHGEPPQAQAETYLGDFIAARRSALSNLEQVNSLSLAFYAAIDLGRRDDAEALAAELKELSTRMHHRAGQVRSALARHTLLRLDGRLSEAIDAVLPNSAGPPNMTTGPCRIFMWTGKPERMRQLLDDLPEQSLSFPVDALEIMYLVLSGETARAMEDLNGLHRRLSQQFDWIGSRDRVRMLELALALNDLELVGTYYQSLLKRPSSRPYFSLTGLSADRVIGQASAIMGDTSRASDFLRAAMNFARLISDRPNLALARLALAQLALNQSHGDQRQALDELSHLAAEFDSMGMTPYLESTNRLLETSRLPGPDGLTGREIEVLRLLAGGCTNQQIADALVISQNTVLRHVTNIFGKIGASNRVEASTYAHRHNLA